jgi:DNA-binding NtrC family response regulator
MRWHPGLHPPFDEAPAVQKARSVARKLAASDLPILITGEVGTGRRTLAAAVAEFRGDGGRTMITFNGFDGVPEELRAHVAANNEAPVALILHMGTLDQQGQTAIAAYIRDRRVLVVAIGWVGNDEDLVADLRAPLEATAITLPPLRVRDSDALAWAKHFVLRAAAELGREPPVLAPEAEQAMLAHQWPGNLAELDSVVRRAVLLVEGDAIGLADLGFGQELKIQPLKEAEAEFRMSYVAKVLAHFDGNRTQAAKALGVDARTVFRYLEKAKKGP